MTAWQEFCSRVELEAEQERSRDLLEQLERLSREDSLTGLANRRHWDETLAREFERSRRQGTELAVLLCDLDEGVADVALRVLAPLGLVFDADSPWLTVSSCTGSPGCEHSVADVRSDAAGAASTAQPSSTAVHRHFVGCERACGSPPVGEVLVARRVRELAVVRVALDDVLGGAEKPFAEIEKLAAPGVELDGHAMSSFPESLRSASPTVSPSISTSLSRDA